jgi:hypothetical protein
MCSIISLNLTLPPGAVEGSSIDTVEICIGALFVSEYKNEESKPESCFIFLFHLLSDKVG